MATLWYGCYGYHNTFTMVIIIMIPCIEPLWDTFYMATIYDTVAMIIT